MLVRGGARWRTLAQNTVATCALVRAGAAGLPGPGMAFGGPVGGLWRPLSRFPGGLRYRVGLGGGGGVTGRGAYG